MKRKKIKIPKNCCIGCGKRKHPDKSTRPSKDTVCTCGRTGHLAHLCLRNGKPRKPKELKETIEIEDQSGNAESSNLLSEACFRLQSNEAGVEGGASQLHVEGQGDKEVGEMFQEESTVTSIYIVSYIINIVLKYVFTIIFQSIIYFMINGTAFISFRSILVSGLLESHWNAPVLPAHSSPLLPALTGSP